MSKARKYLFLSLIVLQAFHLSAQDHVVSGRIENAQSGEAIPDATIYINGTSTGTISDRSGQFTLQYLSLPCELIISHVGYQLRSHSLQDTAGLENLQFLLEPALIELAEVTVISDILRKEHLEKFKEWFLGLDYKELKADILNDSILIFNIQEDGQFDVIAQGPIKVTLPKTGYNLSIDLVHFRLRYNTEISGLHCSILGYFYFEPVDPRSRLKQKRIARKRAAIYYNSSRHFCRSLYQNKLAGNGYKIGLGSKCEPTDTSSTISLPYYTTTYNRDPYGSPQLLLTGFQCNEFRIRYFYRGYYLPVDLTGKPPSYVSMAKSRVIFLGDTVRIYPSGRIPDNAVLFGGSISKKGVASMLPEDYIPSMQ